MWALLFFINQLPTPNPSKNTIYTNKNFRTSCKMTYKEKRMTWGQDLRTSSPYTHLAASHALPGSRPNHGLNSGPSPLPLATSPWRSKAQLWTPPSPRSLLFLLSSLLPAPSWKTVGLWPCWFALSMSTFLHSLTSGILPLPGAVVCWSQLIPARQSCLLQFPELCELVVKHGH